MIGKRFGRWTVLEAGEPNKNGESRWLCRCDCGTERQVLERSLKYGSSLSCGCLRKEEAAKAVSFDLVGQRFGELTVLSKAESGSNGVRWLCKCDCGETCIAVGTLLRKGRKTHCAGNAHEKHYAFTDIAGKRFGRLTALNPTGKSGKNGSVIWNCRCDCGIETEFSYNDLVYSNLKSCGCRKKEHDKELPSLLTRVAGTSMDLLKSKKLPVNNTTGCKGVYLYRGKYMARVVFQKKAYHLGFYNRLEDAVAARKEAEELLFDRVAEHYKRWKKLADQNPRWAIENPIDITVTQKSDKSLLVTLLPYLPEDTAAEEPVAAGI